MVCRMADERPMCNHSSRRRPDCDPASPVLAASAKLIEGPRLLFNLLVWPTAHGHEHGAVDHVHAVTSSSTRRPMQASCFAMARDQKRRMTSDRVDPTEHLRRILLTASLARRSPA
ncbi:hypothetical protein SPRG_12091 [Saprolegnia parasitica CBS 223.65]|uniref:Uncharacterized protein n=1 Tax=Saprolegnia parasitica (strain CBS 223.65) TaxID=695850 RepID=A0A067BVH5_SAPPC|nr:hypothetical protein SPRG_12091 [Saprolegnia parasitica CBS 223.65]KDO22253.1 hypothetical protein SPRG_12091 [Saprolegnia parasitica CBS 223.65]|eukprot:XP_012206989.1 hypothetical protein SPRG_12091 [Saprolegnia parasitica CBS 223.65]